MSARAPTIRSVGHAGFGPAEPYLLGTLGIFTAFGDEGVGYLGLANKGEMV